MSIEFTFSDTIAGYVTGFNNLERWYMVRTSDSREFKVYLTPTTYGRFSFDLDESYMDATGVFNQLLSLNRQFVFTYGTFYPVDGGEMRFEAQWLVFAGNGPGNYRHEEPQWWIKQINSIGNSYLKWQFNHPEETIDYTKYRTFLHLAGGKKTTGDQLQETDTISRLVYGFASAYMLTGNDAFLEGAEKGTEYLREHMRFYDEQEALIYWYHGVKLGPDNKETKLLTSEFGDDYDSLPMYEQIYALAGPTQTYRITGDKRILWDIEQTVKLFERFYKDNDKGGYFSHIDPIGLNPRADSLGANRAKKNWNSVGDHAPAYLINLYLATGKKEYADFLEYTFDTITDRFQDYENSPFVQERFFEDWSHDKTWGWQQDRAVVGHNLKIAWNLMRMQSLTPKQKYVDFARKIAELMPKVGCDLQRGGWYDVVERVIKPNGKHHRFVWHDRKAWWQQEQAILAYLIMHGILKDEEYLRLSREAAAYYSAFFLDHDDGGVYFNTLANGLPYLLGNERFKGSHSMSGYHSMELCYLSAVYINLLITKQPLNFYFKPYPDSLPNNVLRVSPDILPQGSIYISECYINDEPYKDFDANALTVNLPRTGEQIRVRVKVTPKTWLD
ncbi:MAG: AGE family epimerase/isomerase [Candidatus Magnetobacterium sp. LHC-1]|uniref:AGE family epimerase/isomerase n=1 Tax=Candidatus Magnetobacterium casense TaxID=1455061 RepID=A0ABS6RX18_9BACT|nr:AGE family epimerase/isomerase [Candidatus Magnetobacterium casensis]MBF0606887.1 AGE family epimerase/isomerase [Nitrospirota bacterium]MBV6341176.1 AGE family epimerase/isomerase [Candidatus Magnetobacterium casensis]